MRTATLTLLLACSIPGPGPSVAVAQSPADHVARGIAAYATRDPAAAAKQFRLALVADPFAYEPNWRLALALVDEGSLIPDSIKSAARDSLYILAERHAGLAVAADPTGADGHFVLGLAIGRASLSKSHQQRIQRAVEIRTEALAAIALDPAHDGAYHLLGRWNAEIMRLSGFSRFIARRFLGAGIFKEASWQGAIENLERAAELDPSRIYHHLDLAEVYVQRQRFADARAQLEMVDTLPLKDVLDSTYKADARRLLAKIASKA